MKRKLLCLVLLVVFSLPLFSQTRFVGPTGNDISNDCSNPNNPCGTITYATEQALPGDSIIIKTGVYSFSSTQLINKSVIIAAQDSSNKPVISVASNDVFQVSANDVTIKNLRVEMGLTSATGLKGIVGSGNYNNLNIINNEFISIKPYATGMVFQSYALFLSGGSGQSINVSHNIIQPLDFTRDAFGRGVGIGQNLVVGPGGNISNNTILAFYPIQSIANSSNLTVNDNSCIGTVLLTYPEPGTFINVSNNTFDAFNDQVASNLLSLLEIRGVSNNSSSIVSNNMFLNFKNFGFFSSACSNMSVLGNNFLPLGNATNFTCIMANTKLQTSGTQVTNYSNKILIQGNLFNPGVSGTGAAIVFADHYGATNPAFEDTIRVGGPNDGEKNIFDPNIGYYIVLDSLSGNSDSIIYWQGYDTTSMLPFSQSVWALASENQYGITDTVQLEAKVIDNTNNSNLGEVYLFEPLITFVKHPMINQLTVYPNPATNILFIEDKNLKGNYVVSVFSLDGNLIKKFSKNSTENNISIPIFDIADGLYFLKMENETNTYCSKFIKE